MDYDQFIDNALNLHKNIGDDLFTQFRGFLCCTHCGATLPLSAGLVADHLKNGWPKHCGYTMRWVTQQELEANEQSDDPASP